MPRLEEIKQFLSTLTSLGNEAEILAARGEKLEAVPIPDQELSEDIRSLFDDMGELDGGSDEDFSPADSPEDTGGSGEEPLDFSALFDDEEGESETEELPGLPPGLDFDDLLIPDSAEADGGETAGSDEMTGLPPDLPDLPEEPQEEPLEEPRDEPPPDEFTAGDFDFGDLDFSDEGETTDPTTDFSADWEEDQEAGPEEETVADLEEDPDFFSEDTAAIPEDFELSDFSFPDEAEPPADSPEGDDTPATEEGDFPFEDLSFTDMGEDEVPDPEAQEIFPSMDEPEDTEEPEELTEPDESGKGFAVPFGDGEILEFSDEEEEGWQQDTPVPADLDSLEPDQEDLGAEEFSLGDFGKEFGIVDDGDDLAEDDWGPAINIPEGAPDYIESSREEGLFSLSAGEFEKLKNNLNLLPLNVKIAAQEIVAEDKGEEGARIELIEALVQGKSPRAVAGLAGKILGRTLQVPKSYEKRTGLEYEAERESFAYIFREHILPVLRVVLLASVALASLSYTTYQFAYKPIKANSLFKEGIQRIQGEDYRGANQLFSRAYSLWQDKTWYFRYAQGFAEKRQYRLTREKYEELLAQYDDYIHRKTEIRTERKKDKYFVQGSVDYADFESQTMEDFEKAEKILKRLLDTDMYNYSGLLSAGDNYTRWAESDPQRFSPQYEDARNSYQTLQIRYGGKDEILFRLLEVAVRTDDRDEALALRDHFQGKKRARIDSYRYAELGGWLIDKNLIEDGADVLFRSMDADKNVPEVHYHLARYFAIKGDPRDERRALDNAELLFSSSGALNRRRLWRWVDSSGRSGELYYRRGEFIAAEKALREGIGRYEDGLRKTLLKKDPNLGRLYETLGDIAYYQSGDMAEALMQYRKAEDSLVRNPDLFYKKGFILYGRSEAAGSLGEFIKTEEYYPSNRNLLYALGNANYQRHNYSAAEGYYSFLADRLEADRRRMGDLLPDLRSADRALTLNMVKVYNNLGVVLFKLGERTGNKDRSSQALVYWTTAQELAENLFRDPETLTRRDIKNLPYLNMRQILRPLPDYDLQIYQTLPLDLKELYF